MANIFQNLLAADAKARTAGCGLKPELRAAMEASLRFPAVAASPMPETPIRAEDLPEHVVSLAAARDAERKRA